MTGKTQLPTFAQAKKLRQLIASGISDLKAYDVPAARVRYGLAEGTVEEAFSSKFKFVARRLEGLPAAGIFEVATALQSDEPNFELGDLLDMIREPRQVTELTRRRIATALNTISLSGDLDLVEFLQRFWPLEKMMAPEALRDDSTKTVGDVVRFQAFMEGPAGNQQILESLGFYTCSQPQLFRVLEALVDPMTRMQVSGQRVAVDLINGPLKADRFHLVQTGTLSGSPKYNIRPFSADCTPADRGISAALSAFDAATIHERWQEALERRASDPRGAITVARTLLEDTCKWLLTESRQTFADEADLPVLYRQLAKSLYLAPDEHTEQVFKQILGSCQSIVEAIGALRNKLGDAHSQGPKRARPQARHAELAVNLAGTMATFLIATWEARQSKETGAPPRR